MKEIFDLMREKIYINNDKAKNFSKDTHVVNKEYVDNIINEAEAKWKEDCCEWEYSEVEEQWETSCGVLLNPNSNDREVTHYCCCCGKPIKIVEVE